MSKTKDDALLEITRVFDAPPSDVFNAWLKRDEWEAWIGPEGVTCEVPVLEPIVGGQYALTMHMPGGDLIRVAGVFKIIDAPTRLAFTWGSADGSNDTLVTITLRPVNKGTELTLRHEGLKTAQNRDAHGKGWNSALNKLAKYLSTKIG